MTKSELINSLSENQKLSPDEATAVVNMFFDTVRSTLAEGGRVELRGFGSFKMKNYRGYAGRNPRSGVSVEVAPKRLPVFRPGKELKGALNP